MIETTLSDRPVGHQPSRFRAVSRSWFQWMGRVLLVLFIALGCYTLGRHLAVRELEDYKTKNAQLAIDNGKVSAESKRQAVEITGLDGQLKSVQAQLDEIL